MNKFHKRNKSKRKKRRIKTGTIQEVREQEKYNLPFGDIKTHDGTLAHAFKNKGVLLALLTMGEKLEEEDAIGRLVYFEKLDNKYLNEPYIAYEIAECYRALKKLEKAEALTISNYENYKGYPFIDISYLMLKFDLFEEDLTEEIFEKTMNMHDVYPSFKAFDAAMVVEFYFVLGMIYRDKNELVTARKCAEVVSQIDARKGLVLKSSIDFIEKPWLKWKTKIILLLIIGVILGIIGGIIWGIVSVFQMIF